MRFFSIIYAFLLSLCLVGCEKNTSASTVKVAATSIPHAEILELIKPDLKKAGFDLQVIVVEDYNTPNRALADGEVDANFFQHLPFLDMQIKDFGYPLEVAASIHLEPMGLYSHNFLSLKDLKKGSKIGIPSDPSNQARALNLIESVGLIKLKKRDTTTSVLDILENPQDLKFIEIDSPLLARSLEDLDIAAITTNFALQAGLSPQKDALAIEDERSSFVNIVVIRHGEKERPQIQALIKALQSKKVHDYIKTQYGGAVIPAFESS